VAVKIGMTLEKELDLEGDPTLVYAASRVESI
jgi:hypothetical protein